VHALTRVFFDFRRTYRLGDTILIKNLFLDLAAVPRHPEARAFWSMPAWVVLAACTPLVPSPTPLPPPTTIATSAAEHWQIQLHVSGGIAGIRRTINVSGDGQLTVVDEKIHQAGHRTYPRQRIIGNHSLSKNHSFSGIN
jgi:hypothetical protein